VRQPQRLPNGSRAAGMPEEKIDEYAKLLPQMIDSGWWI
jgi:hypothetical protein